MNNKNGRIMIMASVVLPVIIFVGAAVLLLQTHLYNIRERVVKLEESDRIESRFRFDDLVVEIKTRGGDSGAWNFEGVLDKDKNYVVDPAVGVIYDLAIVNASSDLLRDWTITLQIPEDMYVNNTWNGLFEYHQDVLSGNEQVQTLNLAQYTNYDITLEHYMCHAGPLVKLHEGDYFIYHPNIELNENTISPTHDPYSMEGGLKVGFIMYIENRHINYVAYFNKGEIHYHLQTSVLKKPFFWVLVGLVIMWMICLVSTVIVRKNTKHFEELRRRDESAIEQTMQTFVNFIEAKDPSTSGHSLRVAKYSKMLAEKMGLNEDECKHIYCIALMHDCGKIYIPDEILGKPGKLTDEEYEIMKKHTLYGAEILRDFTAIDGMSSGAQCHHERYDGKGYPNGLAGEEIPLIGRIICASDAFDAMNSRRCYRSNLSEDVILNELKNNRGKQFDPVIVDCLLSLITNGDIKFTNPDMEQKNDGGN